MGRKKLPQEVLNLRGTARPDRDRSIVKGNLIKDAREVLSVKGYKILKGKRQKQIFVEKCNQLISLNLLEDCYVESMLQYAYYYDKLLTCIEKINEKGDFVELKDEKGKLYFAPNPYIKLMKDCTTILTQLGSDFGFTPVSRQKLNLEKSVINPLQELMKQLENSND